MPHVLIIKRQDTGLWALPGGFVDAGENALEAALREAHEETSIDWRHMVTDSWTVYTGPMADIRTTAHAWPETSAYGLLLDPQQTAGLPTGPFGGNINEVQAVRWLPIHEHKSVGFGSHQLLIELAIDHL